MAIIPCMPETDDRGQYDEEDYPWYLESNMEWANRNNEAVEWLIDNHKAIREIISKYTDTTCP